jgi:hypothetical protein
MQINGPNLLEVDVYDKSPSEPAYLDVWLNILGRRNVAGLCGTPDDNPRNEWINRKTGFIVPMTQLDSDVSGPAFSFRFGSG